MHKDFADRIETLEKIEKDKGERIDRKIQNGQENLHKIKISNSQIEAT